MTALYWSHRITQLMSCTVTQYRTICTALHCTAMHYAAPQHTARYCTTLSLAALHYMHHNMHSVMTPWQQEWKRDRQQPLTASGADVHWCGNWLCAGGSRPPFSSLRCCVSPMEFGMTATALRFICTCMCVLHVCVPAVSCVLLYVHRWQCTFSGVTGLRGGQRCTLLHLGRQQHRPVKNRNETDLCVDPQVKPQVRTTSWEHRGQICIYMCQVFNVHLNCIALYLCAVLTGLCCTDWTVLYRLDCTVFTSVALCWQHFTLILALHHTSAQCYLQHTVCSWCIVLYMCTTPLA